MNLVIEKFKKKYEESCNKYVKEFCKKQDVEFEFWISNEVGGIASCSNYYFNFQDIVWDVNSNQPKGLIFDWYEESIENIENAINYRSYTQGLRYKDL